MTVKIRDVAVFSHYLSVVNTLPQGSITFLVEHHKDLNEEHF